MPQGPYPTQEKIPASHGRGHSSQRRENPIEKEVGVDVRSYVQGSQAAEPH